LVSYPTLSEQEQETLPKLKQAASPLPVLFEDSTHQLWRCHTIEGERILKVCNKQHIKKSLFWQGMNKLFNVGFPGNLPQIASTYQQIATISSLAVPKYITAQANRFVFATWLNGEPVDPKNINDDMVLQLAEHLGKCHQHVKSSWGAFHSPTLSAEQWSVSLYETLKDLAASCLNEVPKNVLNSALRQAEAIQSEQFVPIMPDLRWDQFIQDNDELSALVDLDAFVYGPRELELILLEHLLDTQQIMVFKKQYQVYREMPDLGVVRLPYQLLLFLMNVLGEQDLERWLKSTSGKEIDLI
jgi:Ser/Thr protein kinase RdoA (MazF antagonist)